ncbi:MAG: synthase subunit [Actinomycetota bacterium]|jgi:F-type H+-transporting ATPase subunit b
MTFTSLLAAGAAETHHWLLPETAEIIYGGIASVLVFGALGKFALPLAKKALSDRTARIQNEIDSARAARAQAEADASRIRAALGDIAAERARLLAEADQQAAAVLTEGRARVSAEMADMEAKALSDIAVARGRAGDELRAEITRLAAVATERVVAAAIDDKSRQDLIEGFISKVGAR